MSEGASAEERAQQIGATFGDLAEQIASLVRDELDRARQELADRAREAAKAGGYVTLAGLFGLAACGAALSVPVLLLRRRLPPLATAALAAGLYGGAAIAFGRKALQRLQQAAPAIVDEKIEQKKQDLGESLKQRLQADEP